MRSEWIVPITIRVSRSPHTLHSLLSCQSYCFVPHPQQLIGLPESRTKGRELAADRTVSFHRHCVCSTPLFRHLYFGSNAIKGLRWFGNFIHCQPTIVYRFKYICTTKRSNRFFNRSIQIIIIINQNRVWLVWLKCSTFHTLFLCFVSDWFG